MLSMVSLATPLAAQQSTKSKDWHKKSDVAKGVDQLAAPSKGNVYANPDRQKALDDAMNDGSTAKPASTDKTTPRKTSPKL